MAKVSIIVPIYNVEKYLKRCIDSIIEQSYTNIEIILVNDGSTDHCLDICQLYSQYDSRIIILNKENGGLSSARNMGLDYATGEYIMFVDSDDWIRVDAVELLLNDIINTHATMAIGQSRRCTEYISSPQIHQSSKIIDKNQAITRMLKGEWISAWAKLYHKSLFYNVRFPLGKTNEDYAILIYIFEKVNYIILNPNEIYFYYIRPNSICTSSLNIRKFDEFYNAISVYEYIKKSYPQKKEWIGYALANLSCSLIKLIRIVWQLTENIYMNETKDMITYLKMNIKKIIFNPYLSIKYKIFLFNMYLGKRCYTTFDCLYIFYSKLKYDSK